MFTWIATIISDDFYHTFDYTLEITANTEREADKIAEDKHGDYVINLDGPFIRPSVAGYRVAYWKDHKFDTFSEVFPTWEDAVDHRDETGKHGQIETIWSV